MSQVPVVTAASDRAEYAQGDPVTVTFSVEEDTRDEPVTRTITWAGHDDEGNTVDGSTTIVSHRQVLDSFTLDSVSWEDTGVQFAVTGLQATGTA